MNKQEIRAIVREMQRIVGILPPEDAGVFGKISAAFEAIIERDADTQRRLAALERVSGGTPGARGEETAAPTSPPIRAVAGTSVICRFCECRWKRHPDGTFQIYGPMFVPCPKCDNSPDFLQNVRAEDPDDFEPPTSPAWTEEQSQAAYDLAFEGRAVIDYDQEGGTLEGVHAASEVFCAAIAKVAPLFVPPKPAPSVEDCDRAYNEALAASLGVAVERSTRHERAGIAAVRALMLESNKGDGASVSGDSGPKAGHNMERGSGCPASDHHADRETSTPQGPKDPAPSPAFTPDREALRKAMLHAASKQIIPGGVLAEMVQNSTRAACENAAMDYFAPLLAERDALRKELAESKQNEVMSDECFDMIREDLAYFDQNGYDGKATPPMMMNDWIRCIVGRDRDTIETLKKERDALRARVEEMERKASTSKDWRLSEKLEGRIVLHDWKLKPEPTMGVATWPVPYRVALDASEESGRTVCTWSQTEEALRTRDARIKQLEAERDEARASSVANAEARDAANMEAEEANDLLNEERRERDEARRKPVVNHEQLHTMVHVVDRERCSGRVIVQQIVSALRAAGIEVAP